MFIISVIPVCLCRAPACLGSQGVPLSLEWQCTFTGRGVHIMLGLVLRSRQHEKFRTDAKSKEQLRTV